MGGQLAIFQAVPPRSARRDTLGPILGINEAPFVLAMPVGTKNVVFLAILGRESRFGRGGPKTRGLLAIFRAVSSRLPDLAVLGLIFREVAPGEPPDAPLPAGESEIPCCGGGSGESPIVQKR